MSVFTSTIANQLKDTLSSTIDDEFASHTMVPRMFDEESMADAYVDDLELAGPGLAAARAEGEPVQVGSMREGVVTRYMAQSYALKMIITEEAMDDGKYPQAINLARRLKRAMAKTIDIDGANVMVRMADTNYLGGDGLPLSSASHTLPHGGTFSNKMAVPMSPSRSAFIVAVTQLGQMVGHDGIIEGYKPKAVVCPFSQWAIWKEIVKSEKAPEAGQFNAINVVKSDFGSIDIVANPYWSNTTTNWALLTDAGGLKWKWRKKASNRTWVDNDNMVMNYSISARWGRGWSDPRAVYCVEA